MNKFIKILIVSLYVLLIHVFLYFWFYKKAEQNGLIDLKTNFKGELIIPKNIKPVECNNEETEFYKDNNHLYYLNCLLSSSSPRCNLEIVQGVDPQTFQYLGEECQYRKDKNFVYYPSLSRSKKNSFLPIIENADSKTFTILYEKTDNGYYNFYAKDKNNVYYEEQIIPGADPKSFQLIFDGDDNPTFYATDKNNVYFRQKLVEKADRQTFEFYLTDRENYRQHDNFYQFISNLRLAFDKNNIYYLPSKEESTYEHPSLNDSLLQTIENINHKDFFIPPQYSNTSEKYPYFRYGFSPKNGFYFWNNENVFFLNPTKKEIILVPQAKPQFLSMDSLLIGLAKNDTFVYFRGKIIENLNPVDLKTGPFPYFGDKNSVYFLKKELVTKKAETGHYEFTTSDTSYQKSSTISNINDLSMITELNCDFNIYKDLNGVYDNLGNKLPDLNPSTFQIIDCLRGKDESYFYSFIKKENDSDKIEVIKSKEAVIK